MVQVAVSDAPLGSARDLHACESLAAQREMNGTLVGVVRSIHQVVTQQNASASVCVQHLGDVDTGMQDRSFISNALRNECVNRGHSKSQAKSSFHAVCAVTDV